LKRGRRCRVGFVRTRRTARRIRSLGTGALYPARWPLSREFSGAS